MSAGELLVEFGNLHREWGWLLVLGINMVVLGTVAFMITPAAAISTVLILGWVLVVSGIVETVQAFRVRRWGVFFLHLIGGVLGVLVGLLIVTGPPAGAFAWTLLFASFFSVLGVFRLITAAHFKFPRWGWVVFDGAVTLVLGILLANWLWSELLLGSRRRSFAGVARLVLYYACVGSPQLASANSGT